MVDASWVVMRSIRAAQRIAELLPASWYATVRVFWHRLRRSLPLRISARAFAGLPGPVHVTDYMHLEGGISRYSSIGQSAVANIEATLSAAGLTWADVTRLLDYGCGYGRVLRWLKGRGFELVAADVNAQAVRFCATEFGATPFLIPLAQNGWALPGSYDVIWVGSVVTHLTSEGGASLLTRLAASLNRGGVLVFTTHGQVRGSGLEYGKDVLRAATEIRTRLAAGGVAYVPSREDPAWGQTFHSPRAVESTLAKIGMQVLRFTPRGWDDHQDVWGVQRDPSPVSPHSKLASREAPR